MATLNQAWSSSLGVVTKTANTLVTTVDTIDTGVSMLNDYAHHARREQQIRYKVTEDDRISNMELEITKARTERMIEIEEWASGTTMDTNRRKELFTANHTAVQASIAEAKSSL